MGPGKKSLIARGPLKRGTTIKRFDCTVVIISDLKHFPLAFCSYSSKLCSCLAAGVKQVIENYDVMNDVAEQHHHRRYQSVTVECV